MTLPFPGFDDATIVFQVGTALAISVSASVLLAVSLTSHPPILTMKAGAPVAPTRAAPSAWPPADEPPPGARRKLRSGSPGDAATLQYLAQVHAVFRQRQLGLVSHELWHDTLVDCASTLAPLNRDHLIRLVSRCFGQQFQEAILAPRGTAPDPVQLLVARTGERGASARTSRPDSDRRDTAA